MRRITRTSRRATGGITAAEREQMAAIVQEWVGIALSTEPADPARVGDAVRRLYAAAGLPPPRVVLVPSPLVMALAGGIAKTWWETVVSGSAVVKQRAATDDDTRAATFDATRVAARSAADDATFAATRAATRDATRDATFAAHDATFDATDVATYAATRDATRAATHYATFAATAATANTYDAADAATCDATDTATLTATRAAARRATRAATRAATRDATSGATDAATSVFSSLCREFGVSPQVAAKRANNWVRRLHGGKMWAPSCAYLAAMRDVLKIQLPEFVKYQAWEDCAREGGYRYVHPKFCLVVDRPEVLCVDAAHRPHCETGPSHRWRDGWSLWYWHGVRVTEQIVMRPDTITVEQIRAERNEEVRRVMIERMGADRYVREARLTLIDEAPADHPIIGLRTGRLWADAANGVYIADVLNSTPEPDGSVKRYHLMVDGDAYDGAARQSLHAAVASTWRVGTDMRLAFADWRDYRPGCET